MATTPISNATGLNSLLRTQSTGSVGQAANRQSALTATNRSASSGSSSAPALKNITLSSSKSPPTNLPRGSIVDKLV